MKQKMKIRRKNKMTPKKAFTIVGVSLLALVAAAGTAWGFNNHYKWVELPAWLTLPSEEVPAEPDHAVVILGKTQEISTFQVGLIANDDIKYGSSAIISGGFKSVEFNQTDYRFVIDVDTVGSITLYSVGIEEGLSKSLPFELENGFVYDFSDFVVVADEALVPVVTAIA